MLCLPACLLQVRVEGLVEKLPEQESTEYYHSRPRGSQVGCCCCCCCCHAPLVCPAAVMCCCDVLL
jgi:hypothetical protein